MGCKVHTVDWKSSCAKPFSCNGCKEMGLGARYRCVKCDYELHKSCFEAQSGSGIISPGGNLPVGSTDTFVFLRAIPAKPRWCDACGEYMRGFFYHCKEKNTDLHPCCSDLRGRVSVAGTDFVLMAGLGEEKKCLLCKEETSEATRKTRAPGWSYLSACGDYRLHVYCLMTRTVLEAWQNGNEPQICRANGRKRDKVGLIVNSLVGLIFGDPTALVDSAFQILWQ